MRGYWARFSVLAIVGAAVALRALAAPDPASTPGTAAPGAPANELAEVTVLPQKTTAAGDVIAVGVPRLQLADAEGFGPLIFRSRTSTVFAEDAHWVSIWDAVTGTPLQHIARAPGGVAWGNNVSLVVSADGEWLATGSSHVVRLFRRPFDQPFGELPCLHVLAFSHDAKLVACTDGVLGVWDVAQRKPIARVPASVEHERVDAAGFAPDDHSLVLFTRRAALRWDFASTGKVTPIYQASAEIRSTVISLDGSAAYIRVSDDTALVMDLKSAKVTKAPADYGVAISPSGQRLAMEKVRAVQVIDVATGQSVGTAPKASGYSGRIAFGETDESLAYVESGRIRVAALPGPPSAPIATTRFVGWRGDSVALLERSGAVRALSLATQTWSAGDRGALAVKPLAGAPGWAKWVVPADGKRAMAAEPSKRHELAPEKRGVAPCEPKLRVWTAVGGPRTLTMTCPKAESFGHEVAGWEIGGGWAVGVGQTTARVFDARTGRPFATLELEHREPERVHPEYAAEYWQAALSPAGDWLAVVWRRAELPPFEADPADDAMHNYDRMMAATCVTGEHDCQQEYVAELWSLRGAPRLVWQARQEIPAARAWDPAATMPVGVRVVTFDPAGKYLLIGTDSGEIRVVSTADPSERREPLHRTAIQALSVDPSGTWVYSEEAAGEQRIWRL